MVRGVSMDGKELVIDAAPEHTTYFDQITLTQGNTTFSNVLLPSQNQFIGNNPGDVGCYDVTNPSDCREMVGHLQIWGQAGISAAVDEVAAVTVGLSVDIDDGNGLVLRSDSRSFLNNIEPGGSQKTVSLPLHQTIRQPIVFAPGETKTFCLQHEAEVTNEYFGNYAGVSQLIFTGGTI